MAKKTKLPDIYYQVVELIKASGAYLVGGAVRDLLLEVPAHDLDFSLPKDAVLHGRRVADRLQGDFYLLDPDRGAARVILRDENQQRIMVDFTNFQGDTIEQDLRARDFTITSLAVDILQESKILDPCGGVQDLKDGLIRCTTPDAIKTDPLRSLRAVRMAAQHRFHILPETREQIRAHQSGLAGISGERIRDELFRILAGPRQAAALQTLQQLGTYGLILPGEFTPRHNSLLRVLERFWALLTSPHDQESAASWALGLFVHRLGRYRDQAREHLAQEPVSGRSVYQLTFLVPLLFWFWDEAPCAAAARDLPLGNQELDRAQKAAQAARWFRLALARERIPLPLETYRYYREFGPAGVEGVFLGLADRLSLEVSPADPGWPPALDTGRFLLDGWWERMEEWVDPPALLTGDDLQELFDLEPGPRIGALLEELREAQVEVGLDSRQEAVDYVTRALSSDRGENGR